MSQREIITRRCLPHWYVPGAAHFITYRLHGSLPRSALDQITAKKAALLGALSREEQDSRARERVHKQLFAYYDSLLDQHQDLSTLAVPRVASIIRSNLYHHHGSKYFLYAYCVMSNHVHVLLQPVESPSDAPGEDRDIGEREDSVSPLSSIMHSLKSYTAHEANRVLHRTGTFWQSESYDHWVRDEEDLERIVAYIANNPVTTKRVKSPHEWFFCSCQDRYLTDVEVSGWLRWE